MTIHLMTAALAVTTIALLVLVMRLQRQLRNTPAPISAPVKQQSAATTDEMFRALIEHSSDIIAVLTPDGTMTYINPSMRAVLGYEPQDVLGRSVFDLLQTRDIARARESLRTQADDNEEIRCLPLDLRHSDGTWRSFEMTLTPGRIDDTKRIIANARDVTERNAMTEALARARRLSDLGRLAATIAHEINNVLMAIQPFAEIVRRHAHHHSELARASEHISSAVQRGRRISHQILRFARPSDPQLAAVDLHELVEWVFADLRATLPANVQLVSSVAPGTLVRADHDQLMQVFMNLIINASEAMPGGGQVKISSEQSSSRVAIEVRDDGIGMTSDVLRKLWDPLFSTKPRGTGLGLPIVHQIVQKHGGSIAVWSKPGGGSTFRIELDAAPAPVTDQRAVEEPDGAPARRILLVEDDEAVANGISQLLEMDRFDVRSLPNASGVDGEVKRFRPDVVMLDCQLPDADGEAILRSLRQSHPGLPVILTSGTPLRPTLEPFIAHQNVRFLMKPFDFDALLATIHELTVEHGIIAEAGGETPGAA